MRLSAVCYSAFFYVSLISKPLGRLVQNLKWEKHSSPFTRHEWEAEVRSDRPDPAVWSARCEPESFSKEGRTRGA